MISTAANPRFEGTRREIIILFWERVTLARPSTGTFAVMLIAESQSTFRDFLAQRDKDPTRLLPEELLTLGFAFYESTRATDALPADDASFGDALLFQWGTREALLVTMVSATTSTSPASSSRRLAKTTTQCFNSPASCNTSSPPTFAQSRRAIAGAVASKPYLSSKPSPWATPPSRRSRDGLPERSSSEVLRGGGKIS